MKRRSLWGSSHDRCRWAARPDGKRRKPKTTSSMPCAHVGLAAGRELVGLLAGEVQHDGHVVRPEAPQRVLVGAQLAEVQAVAVDVADVAQLARVGDLLELVDAGVVLQQVPHHQHLARPPLGARRRARRRVTDWASGFSTKQCLPASRTRTACSAWPGTGVASTTASSSGSPSRSSKRSVNRAPGNWRAMRARTSSRPSQHQRSVGVGQTRRSCAPGWDPSSPGRRRRR